MAASAWPLDVPQTEQPEALPAFRDAIARYFNALQAERVRVTCIRLRDDGTKQAMLLDKRNGTMVRAGAATPEHGGLALADVMREHPPRDVAIIVPYRVTTRSYNRVF